MESELRRIFRARQSAPRDRAAARKSQDGVEEELLRELHHRVNNIMQMISSLVQLQAHSIGKPETLEVFEEFGGRVQTMALVHQKVNRDGDWGRVEFPECLEALAETVLRSRARGVNVRRQFDIGSVALPVKTAISVGLIANELLSNRLRHAFAGRKDGLVTVSLERSGDRVRLVIGDDGVAPDPEILECKSLGVRLVKIFTSQIHGQMEYKNESGAQFMLVFKDTASTAM